MGKYKIVWSPKSLTDLNRLYGYILHNLKEPDTARNLYNKIINSISKLTSFPERYPDISYYGKFNKNCRRLRVDKFIIIYKVDINSKEIFILHIFHSNQNYLNLI